MSAPVTLRYEGDGEFRATSGYWASQCDKAFTVGEMYRITEHYERSNVSHNHFFATIADAHGSLPDHMLAEYPSTEHLRKKALIHKGYADERSIVCASKAEALRMAAFVRPMDEYAVVVPSEAVVRVYTAQSQSRKAMGGKAFQESKQAVLDFIDDLLGIERGATAKSAGYHVEYEPNEPQSSGATPAAPALPDEGLDAIPKPIPDVAATPNPSDTPAIPGEPDVISAQAGLTAGESETQPGAVLSPAAELECIRKLLSVVADAALAPKERAEILAESADIWLGTLGPERKDFVTAVFTTSKKVLRGELPADKAKIYLEGLAA